MPGAFYQLGSGVQQAVWPFTRERDLETPRDATEEALRFVGNMLGYGALAAAGGAIAGAAGVTSAIGRVAVEGTVLTARDVINDVVEDEITPGKFVRQVAFNYVVPGAITKVLRGKASRAVQRLADEPKAFVTSASGRLPEGDLGRARLMRLKTSKPSADEAFATEWMDARTSAHLTDELSYLITPSMEERGLVRKAISEGKIKTEFLDPLVQQLRPGAQQLMNLHAGRGLDEGAIQELKNYGLFNRELLFTMRREGAQQFAQWRIGLGDALSVSDHESSVMSGLAQVGDRMKAPTPQMAQRIASIRGVLDDVASQADEAGLMVENPHSGEKIPFGKMYQENYLPRYVDFRKIKSAWDATLGTTDPGAMEVRTKLGDFIEKVTGEKISSPLQGSAILDRIVKRQSDRGLPSLMVRTTDAPWHDPDLRATLPRYLEDMARLLAEKRTLGMQVVVNGEAMPLRRAIATKVGELGGDVFTLNNINDTFTHVKSYNPGVRQVSDVLRGINIVSKMGLSVVGNVAGWTNTSTVFGLRNTLLGTRDWMMSRLGKMSEEISNFPQLAGAVRRDIETAFETETVGKMTGTFLRKTGFTAVEQGLRSISALTARRFVIGQMEALRSGETLAPDVLRLLEKMGITRSTVGKEGPIEEIFNRVAGEFLTKEGTSLVGTLSKGDPMLRAGFEGSRMTQFLGDVLDNPAFASSPIGKLFFQMRTFSYQQARFMKEQIFDELIKHKNPRPFFRLVGMGGAVGEVVNNMRDLVRLKDPRKRSEFGSEALGGLNIGDAFRKAHISFSEDLDFPVNRLMDNLLIAGYMGEFLDLLKIADGSGGDYVAGLLGPSGGMASEVLNSVHNPGSAGELVGEIMATGAAASGHPLGIAARMAFPGIKTTLGEGRSAREKGIFQPVGMREQSIYGRGQRELNKSRERITHLLQSGSIQKAEEEVTLHNRKIDQLMVPKLGMVNDAMGKMRESLTISPKEFKKMVKVQLLGGRQGEKVNPRVGKAFSRMLLTGNEV